MAKTIITVTLTSNDVLHLDSAVKTLDNLLIAFSRIMKDSGMSRVVNATSKIHKEVQ